MATRIEMTPANAYHARLETLAEWCNKLAERFYRSYAIDLPDFKQIGFSDHTLSCTLRSRGLSGQPVHAEILVDNKLGKAKWHDWEPDGGRESVEREVNLDSDADWEWINNRVRAICDIENEYR